MWPGSASARCAALGLLNGKVVAARSQLANDSRVYDCSMQELRDSFKNFEDVYEVFKVRPTLRESQDDRKELSLLLGSA